MDVNPILGVEDMFEDLGDGTDEDDIERCLASTIEALVEMFANSCCDLFELLMLLIFPSFTQHRMCAAWCTT